MKKFLGIAATVLAAGMMAGCGGCIGCNGCSSCNSSTKNNALTNSNWFNGTGYKGIQPFFIVDGDNSDYTSEKLTYAVTFDKDDATNGSYSVDYKDGVYVTEFYAAHRSWNGNTIENYKLEEDVTEVLYCYKTELTISVQYKKGDAASEWFNDSIVTECWFRAAEYSLRPVYSSQEIISHSPSGFSASSVEGCYDTVELTYENFYNYKGTEVTSFTYEKGKDEKKETFGKLNKRDNTVFDNSSLYIAVRSMKLSTSFSQQIDLFSAAAGGVSSYNVSGSDKSLPDEEHKAVSAALADKGLYTPVTTDDEGNTVEDKGIATVAMNISYSGGLQGTTQTVWYAAIENQNNNTARATMLKISVPLSYGLGTMNYTLKEVNSTIWNG